MKPFQMYYWTEKIRKCSNVVGRQGSYYGRREKQCVMGKDEGEPCRDGFMISTIFMHVHVYICSHIHTHIHMYTHIGARMCS